MGTDLQTLQGTIEHLRAIQPALQKLSICEIIEKVSRAAAKIPYLHIGSKQDLLLLLRSEIGNEKYLDGFLPYSGGGVTLTKAIGPGLIFHVLSGNIPHPTVLSPVYGLLTKSVNLVKLDSANSAELHRFVGELHKIDPFLADCIGHFTWTRDDEDLTNRALNEADAVIVYGADATVSALRAKTEGIFMGYGHRASFGVIGREFSTEETALLAARESSLYRQLGCLSPQVFYVEEGGPLSPREFAEKLAEKIHKIPAEPIPLEAMPTLIKFRGAYEFRSMADPQVGYWGSNKGMDWAVIFELDNTFCLTCGYRTLFVKPFRNFQQVKDGTRLYHKSISTIGMALLRERCLELTELFTDTCVSRYCAIGRMQDPPVYWHHDQVPNITPLLRWQDMEI